MNTTPIALASATTHDPDEPATAGRQSITDEIVALRSMPTPDLVDCYEEAFGKPPRSKNRDHLWRRIAWRIQEERFGGLSQVAKRRLNELITELDLPFTAASTVRASLEHSSKPGQPVVGTTLTRQWKGTEVRATRVEAGWQHDAVVHRSLSALVKSITGTHASGPAWFGVAKAKGARK